MKKYGEDISGLIPNRYPLMILDALRSQMVKMQ